MALRRWGYLLLGGVLMPAYAGLGGLVPTAIGYLGAALLVGVLLLATGLVPAVRQLELGAVRALLAHDELTDEVELAGATGRSWPARARMAAWFTLHLVAGAAACGLLVGAPVLAVYRLGAPWGVVVAALAVPVVALGGVALGGGLARLAPRAFGPSAQERLAVAEARARRLAAGNRLAREVHDSVGHALTVMTLQAAAAEERADDPAYVRAALATIAATGRDSMGDLDRVLAVLGAAGGEEEMVAGDLGDLDALLAAVRATGSVVRATVSGDADAIPSAASRQAYRIIRECLTNALRHAPRAPVAVEVAVGADRVLISVSNPVRRSRPVRAGRGLTGIRDRVATLGGTVTFGAADGAWRVVAEVPRAVAA